MKRRASADSGFFIGYFLNLIFNCEWLAAAFVMLVLHYWLHIPKFLFWACIAIWMLWALGITLFLGWAVSNSDSNPGPGGQRTSERLRQKAQSEKDK